MTDLAGVIDRSSSIPFHLQLRKLLEHQIETGQWRQGDRSALRAFLERVLQRFPRDGATGAARPRAAGADPQGEGPRCLRQSDLIRLLASAVGGWAFRR